MTNNPIVTIKNNTVVANSRDVAAFFGKNHNEVVRRIGELREMGISDFAETFSTNPQNKQSYRHYEMTRDGFTLLAMGFTGKKALAFKLAYIAQFNAMEAELKTKPLNETPEAILQKHIGHVDQQTINLIARILVASVQAATAPTEFVPQATATPAKSSIPRAEDLKPYLTARVISTQLGLTGINTSEIGMKLTEYSIKNGYPTGVHKHGTYTVKTYCHAAVDALFGHAA